MATHAELIAQAKLDEIEARTKAILAIEKVIMLEADTMTLEQWKLKNNQLHEHRIAILQLKGEYPLNNKTGGKKIIPRYLR